MRQPLWGSSRTSSEPRSDGLQINSARVLAVPVRDLGITQTQVSLHPPPLTHSKAHAKRFRVAEDRSKLSAELSVVPFCLREIVSEQLTPKSFQIDPFVLSVAPTKRHDGGLATSTATVLRCQCQRHTIRVPGRSSTKLVSLPFF